MTKPVFAIKKRYPRVLLLMSLYEISPSVQGQSSTAPSAGGVSQHCTPHICSQLIHVTKSL